MIIWIIYFKTPIILFSGNVVFKTRISNVCFTINYFSNKSTIKVISSITNYMF